MDLKLVKKIIDLIAESEVNEVSIEEGDFKIKVKKQSDQAQVSYSQPMVAAPSVAPTASTPSKAASTVEESTNQVSNGQKVEAPIVGTFYEAPSPDSDPFVKVGDKVSKGQTLCIIEAMKIMNEIESDCAGTITQIHVQNGTPVEFGQPLFTISNE